MKKCTKCGQTKSPGEFNKNASKPDGLDCWCRQCKHKADNDRRARNPEHVRRLARESSYTRGDRHPLGTNPKCACFLGVYVAERVLSRVFEEVERAPCNNPGYDFTCKKGYKIDVKSSTRQKRYPDMWKFAIEKNKVADYFLCIAFNDRNKLEPEHVWLIPGGVINNRVGVSISETTLDKWNKYEMRDKLESVICCCNKLRGEAK